MTKKQNKKHLFLKILFIAGILSALLLVAAASIVIWKYYETVSSDRKVLLLEKTLSVPEKVTLGERFEVKMQYKVPWGTQETENAFLTVPENMLVYAPPYFRVLKYAWGYKILEAIYPLQAFRDGKSSNGGTVIARFRNKKNVESILEEKLPAITVQPLKVTSSDLLTEGELIAKKTVSSVPYIAVLLILVLVIGTLLYFIFRKKNKKLSVQSLPPWVQAIHAIGALLQKVRNGDTRTEQSIAELSDIVRAYMEERFSIRAAHQTSDEFFTELNHKRELLTPRQQQFLRKFTSSADLVKFAHLAADLALVEDAAFQAQELIKETIPEEQETKNGNKEKGKK